MTVKASLFNKKRKIPTNSSLRRGFSKIGEATPAGRLFILCAAVFAVGLILGAIAVSAGKGMLSAYVEYLTKSQLILKAESTLYENFLSSIIPKLLLLLLCCLFSHCAYGAPALITLILFNGMSAGMIGGYMYAFSGLRGILYNIFVNTPSVLIFTIAFLKLTVNGLNTSVAIYDMAFKGVCRSIKQLSTEVYHSLAIGAAMSCGAAAVEAILFALLGKILLRFPIR